MDANKEVLDAVNSIQVGVDLIYDDLDSIDKLANAVRRQNEENKQLRSRIDKLEYRIGEAVDEAVQKHTQPLSKLLNSFVESKTKVIRYKLSFKDLFRIGGETK